MADKLHRNWPQALPVLVGGRLVVAGLPCRLSRQYLQASLMESSHRRG